MACCILDIITLKIKILSLLNVARHPEQSAVHHFPLNAGKCKPVYSMSQSAIEHMLLRPFVCCLLNDHYCLHNWES